MLTDWVEYITSVNSFHLRVKGEQSLHALLSQDDQAGLTLDVFDIGQDAALECDTPTDCAIDVPGVEPSTLTEFDLTVVPAGGGGSYTVDINDDRPTQPTTKQ